MFRQKSSIIGNKNSSASQVRRRFAAPGALLIILLTLISLVGGAGLGTANSYGFASSERATLSTTEDLDLTVYLPVLISGMQLRHFGGEANWYSNLDIQNKARSANVQWMRVLAFSWRAIEEEYQEPRQYNWATIDENALLNLSQRGFNLIGVVRFTPSWAQMYPPNTYCGPVATEALDEFAEFMFQLVKRYSVAPYNILHWEIINEPDVGPLVSDPATPEDQIYGCWGDPNDPYFGGGHYAEMLKLAYPAIKAANPQVKLLIGGLLLNCDPTNPPPNDDCLPSKFFEGILLNQGASYFDYVNFHGYANFNVHGLITDEIDVRWAHRGGIVLGKIDFLRAVMTQYGINKSIIQSEGALFCRDSNGVYCKPPGTPFFEAQADYVVWLYIRNWAAGNIPVTIWYTVDGPGWQAGGLLDSAQQPKPAYYAYQFMTGQLGNAEYTGQITGYTGIRIYAFTRPTKRIWVAWSPDQTPYPMTLPSGVIQVLDKYGAVIEPVDNQITVKSPVYIELAR